jgi:hypothetical protein
VTKCGCTPGTEENGWHETRSEACLRAESAAFARWLEEHHDFLHDLAHEMRKS